MADMVYEKSWEEFLRRMLPPGSNLPDYEHLDYSIALEYKGPLPSCDIPQVHPLDLRSISVTLPAPLTDATSAPVPVVEPIALRFSRFYRSNRVCCEPVDADRATATPMQPDHRSHSDALNSVMRCTLPNSSFDQAGSGIVESIDRESKDLDAKTPQFKPEDCELEVPNFCPTSSASGCGISSADCKSTIPGTGSSDGKTTSSESVSYDMECSLDISANTPSVSNFVGPENVCKTSSDSEDSDRDTALSESEEDCFVSASNGDGLSPLHVSRIDCSSKDSDSIVIEAKDPHDASVSESKDHEIRGSNHVEPFNTPASSLDHADNLRSKRLHSVASSSCSMDKGSSTYLCLAATSASSSNIPGRINQRPNQRIREMPVTFNATDASEDDDSDSSLSRIADSSSDASTHDGSGRHGVASKGRKRLICSRCGRGTLLKGRESCLVCGAGYCGCCVIRAMGSMPEGRKCVTCIGQPIEESKRSRLGRRSRVLLQIFCPLEIRQIMKAEIECPANQLHSEQIVVNDRPLSQEELAELLGCPMPPRRLKPGRYWYDRVSGFWGKEGGKPDTIISSKLAIGGKLQEKASNGNTEVCFNGREITKEELKVLKWAKIQCPRGTNFWLSDDGSIVEEGLKHARGKIWEKATTRLLCSFFSLPVPHDRIKDERTPRSMPEFLGKRNTRKLLILGSQGSGTSTILKQAKYLHGKFSQEELEELKFLIQSNIYKYLGILLEARERFEEEVSSENQMASRGHDPALGEESMRSSCKYSLNSRLKHFSDWLLDTIAMGNFHAFFPASSREHASSLVDVWNDPAIRETYKRKSEIYALPDAAKYFLDRAMEISSNDYQPSEMDILYADGLSLGDGLASVDLFLDDKSQISTSFDEKQGSTLPPTKYQLIRLSANVLGEGCKWLEMFEDMRAVIFCVSLSDYDQVVAAGNSTPPQNKMMLNKGLFECVVRHSSFEDIPFVLILNKFDAFEEKISRVPLTVCEWFKDFRPVRTSYIKLANQAYFYIAKKFKSLHSEYNNRKMFVWQGNARQRDNINEAFKFIKEVLIWNDEKDNNSYVAEDSQCSTQTTSTPCVTQD